MLDPSELAVNLHTKIKLSCIALAVPPEDGFRTPETSRMGWNIRRCLTGDVEMLTERDVSDR
jgi:hypothetical protein